MAFFERWESNFKSQVSNCIINYFKLGKCFYIRKKIFISITAETFALGISHGF